MNAQTILDGVSLEVNLAYRAILAAQERISLARTSVAQARENRRLMQLRYRNGNATPTDVVDAETTVCQPLARRGFFLVRIRGGSKLNAWFQP